MFYDANGNLTADLDRDIVTIQYNLLNLPKLPSPLGEGLGVRPIQFKNGNQIRNLYDASGAKLRSMTLTYPYPIEVPVTGTLSEEQMQETNGGWLQATGYIKNREYILMIWDEALGWGQDNSLVKTYNPEGYKAAGMHYYRRDHLGNIREVWRAAYTVGSTTYPATTVQRTQYYPSGLPWSEGYNANLQQRKYNGKEWIEAHGYDMFDYGARGYYPASMRFTTMDPLAEKYYSVSPYVYCLNNPVRFVDPDGRDVTLRGYNRGAFTQALQERVGASITIKLEENGFLSYSVNDEDNISANAQLLMNAIDNRKIQLDLHSVKGFSTPDGEPMVGGAFLGNTVIKDKDGNVEKVIAKQAVNVDFLNKLDAASADPNANGLMHEVSEAYIGAINSFKSGISAPKATEKDVINPNSAYYIAHNAAYPQPEIITYTSLPNNYYTTQWAALKITVSQNSPLYGWYKNGKRIVLFYSK